MPSVRVRMASKQVSTPACTSASEGSYTILLSLTTSLMPNKGVCTSVDWSAFHRACTNTVQDGSWNADRWASTQSCPVNQCLHELLSSCCWPGIDCFECKQQLPSPGRLRLQQHPAPEEQAARGPAAQIAATSSGRLPLSSGRLYAAGLPSTGKACAPCAPSAPASMTQQPISCLRWDEELGKPGTTTIAVRTTGGSCVLLTRRHLPAVGAKQELQTGWHNCLTCAGVRDAPGTAAAAIAGPSWSEGCTSSSTPIVCSHSQTSAHCMLRQPQLGGLTAMPPTASPAGVCVMSMSSSISRELQLFGTS